MKIILGATLIAAAALAAAPAQAQPRAHAPARPTLEGYWRVNFTLSLEAPPGVPYLVVSEKAASAIAAAEGKAMSD